MPAVASTAAASDDRWNFRQTYKYIVHSCSVTPLSRILSSLSTSFCSYWTCSVCVCSIREQNKTGKKADPTWCISFNFVDLKHKDVFASCGGVRVRVNLQLLLLFAVLCSLSSILCFEYILVDNIHHAVSIGCSKSSLVIPAACSISSQHFRSIS